jgi:hypothetical protein
MLVAVFSAPHIGDFAEALVGVLHVWLSSIE